MCITINSILPLGELSSSLFEFPFLVVSSSSTATSFLLRLLFRLTGSGVGATTKKKKKLRLTKYAVAFTTKIHKGKQTLMVRIKK